MKLKTDYSYILELSPEEARWLKLMTQNPMGAENSRDYNLRKSFFDTLPDIKELDALAGE